MTVVSAGMSTMATSTPRDIQSGGDDEGEQGDDQGGAAVGGDDCGFHLILHVQIIATDQKRCNTNKFTE